MKPRDCTTEDEICACESDTFPSGPGAWSIVNGDDYVSIHAPNGDGFLTIPKDQFNAIVDWYNTDQPTNS